MSKEEEWTRRWPHFRPEEVLSPHGLAQWERGNLLISEYAMDMLEDWRHKVGRILINNDRLRYRAYRSPRENEVVGGATFSRHVQGIAFDTTPLDMDLHQYHRLALEFGWSGVGLYRTFVHLDTRPTLRGRIFTWTG